MNVPLLALAVALLIVTCLYGVVWARWRIRDRRRRRIRLAERERRRDELERTARQLRLRINRKAAA